MKKVVWQQITGNCWVERLLGDVSLCVQRNRSWKAQGDAKPFKIEVFGNIWVQPHREGFASLAEAQRGAEKIAKKIVRGLVAWASSRAAGEGR
jgi:hypothetical protein